MTDATTFRIKATTFRIKFVRANLIDRLSLGAGIILAAIIVLSTLATAEQNNANPQLLVAAAE